MIIFDIYEYIAFFFLGTFFAQEGHGINGSLNLKECLSSILFAAIWPVTLLLYFIHKKKGGSK